MNNGFEHDVLGEMNADQFFWIFPKKVAFYLVVGIGMGVLLGKMFHWNAIGIFLSVVCGAISLTLCLMAVLKKNEKEYFSGGGLTYLDILERKVLHGSRKKVMSLCAETEEDKKGGMTGDGSFIKDLTDSVKHD